MPEINITEEGKKLFDVEIAAMESVKNTLDERFEKIVKLICDCKGKVVITGMGKPGHIGKLPLQWQASVHRRFSFTPQKLSMATWVCLIRTML